MRASQAVLTRSLLVVLTFVLIILELAAAN